jgi:hypothetical protein
MRRLLAIILLPIYLLATGGMVIAKHYCGGELAKVSVLVKANCCCDEECSSEVPSNDSEDCCSDELSYAKVDVDQEFGLKTIKGFKFSGTDFGIASNFASACNWTDNCEALTNEVLLTNQPYEAVPKQLYLLYCQQKLCDDATV